MVLTAVLETDSYRFVTMVVTTRTSDTLTNGDDAMKLWVTEQLNNVITSFTERLDTMATQFQQSRSGTGESSSRFSRMGKLEFPKFHGDDVQGWLFRVKQFFDVDNVHAADKIKMVSIHLYDRALTWHLQFIKAQGEEVEWAVYEEAVLKRFGSVNEDPMAELKNLRYGTSMKEYQDKFEQLLTQVDVTESQSISLFIAGLPHSNEMTVRMFKPKTLIDAFSLAGFQEASVAIVKQKTAPLLPTPKTTPNQFVNRNMHYPNRSNTFALPGPSNQVVAKHPALPEAPPRKQLSQKELAEKRAKNLCFYCDQKYMPGHKCSGQMYALEVTPYEEESDEEVFENDQLGGELLMSECFPQNHTSPQISLNALSGIPTYNTMRIRGNVGKHLLHLLLDTGSTHNFLDIYTAKKLGCKLTKTCPLLVNVAGGNKLVSQYMVYVFKWSIQGQMFQTDVMLLPLGGCEMVLGIQWLSTLGTVRWNFKDLVMKFVYEGKKVCLRGTYRSELQWMSGKKLQK